MARKRSESGELGLQRLERAEDDHGSVNHYPQPMVQLIESEIRCLSLLLRLDISNLSQLYFFS